jgi:hypothetical protein
MADYEEVVISPKTEGKGKAFRAMKVSAVMADALWEMGESDKHDRPVYATFVASEGEIRPFVANLVTGRPATPTDSTHYHRRAEAGYEFMRSAGYKVTYQKHEEGTAATLFLPDLLALDPGMVDPKGIKFVIVAGKEYLETEAKKMPVKAIVDYVRRLPLVKEENEPEKDWRGHLVEGWKEPLSREVLEDMVPMSYLFALYLGNRSRAPIPPDGRFYLELFLACLKRGLASWPVEGRPGYSREHFGQNAAYKFTEENAESAKLAPSVAFMADHEEVEGVLAAECSEYFRRVEGK